MTEEATGGQLLPAKIRPADTAMATVDRLLGALETGNLTPEAVKTVAELSERFAERAAAQEFNEEFRAFKAKVPNIPKTGRVRYRTKGGTLVSFPHTELESIAEIVDPILFEHGFSYTWDSEDLGDRVKVTFRLSHVNGHSRTADFASSKDAGSPTMSGSQKGSSAWKVARRQSMIGGLGLVEVDDEERKPPGESITPEQVAELTKAISKRWPNDEKQRRAYDQMLELYMVDSMEQMTADNFAAAMQLIGESR